ncbi:MAG: flagellar biosynthetic protein FliQ [Planctomycetia bacterium]
MESDLIELVRQSLATGMLAIAPALLVGFAVATVMGLVQSATGVHETLVGLVPRLAAMAVVLFLTLPWMLERLVDLMRSTVASP